MKLGENGEAFFVEEAENPMVSHCSQLTQANLGWIITQQYKDLMCRWGKNKKHQKVLGWIATDTRRCHYLRSAGET